MLDNKALEKEYLGTGLPIEIYVKTKLTEKGYKPHTSFFEDGNEGERHFRELDIRIVNNRYEEITDNLRVEFDRDFLISCKSAESNLFYYAEAKDSPSNWGGELPITNGNSGRIAWSSEISKEFTNYAYGAVKADKDNGSRNKGNRKEKEGILWSPCLELASASNYFMKLFYDKKYFPLLMRYKNTYEEFCKPRYDPDKPSQECVDGFLKKIGEHAKIIIRYKLIVPMLVYSNKINLIKVNRYHKTKNNEDFECTNELIYYIMPPQQKMTYLKDIESVCPFPVVVCKEETFESSFDKVQRTISEFEKNITTLFNADPNGWSKRHIFKGFDELKRNIHLSKSKDE
ncbi:MAG: hypothetical protein ABIJ10_05995 [Candidatus Micrarchaeota archaeon]